MARKLDKIDVPSQEEAIIEVAAPLWRERQRLAATVGESNPEVKRLDKKINAEREKWLALGGRGHSSGSFARNIDRAVKRERKGKETLKTGDEVFDSTSEELTLLKESISEHFEKQGTARDVVLRLINAHPPLSPADLLISGETQAAAIAIAFASHPKMGRDLAEIVAHVDPENPAYKEAMAALQSVHNILAKPYEMASNSIEAREDLAADTVIGNIKSGVGNIGKEIAKNPGAALAIIGGSILALTLAYKYGPDPLKTAMRGVGITGAAVGGVALLGLGADFAVRAYRDDNKGITDWLGWHPDSITESDAMKQAMALTNGLDKINRQAAMDLVLMGETPTSVVFDLFDDALRKKRGKISVNAILSRGGIDSEDTHLMDDEACYQAIEYFMLQCADADGVPASEPKETRVKRGLAYFKANFAKKGRENWPLFLAQQELNNPIGTPPEGTWRMSRALIPLGGSPEAEDYSAGERIYEMLKPGFGDKLSVVPVGEYQGERAFRINGYLWQYKYHPENGGIHEFIDPDPVGGKQTLTIRASEMNSFDVKAVISEIELRMEKKMKAAIQKMDSDLPGTPNADLVGDRDIVYNKNGYWEFSPALTLPKYDGFSQGTQHEVPLIFVVHEEFGEVSLFLDNGALEVTPLTIVGAIEKTQDSGKLKEIIEEQASYSLGDLGFTVVKMENNTSGQTVVSIEYGSGNKGGTLTFEKNIIVEIDIEDPTRKDPELLAARESFARRSAQEFKNDFVDNNTTYSNLEDVYEGYWKGEWWENAEIFATRTWETLIGGQYGKNHLGRGILHHREQWWEGTMLFKMEEYQNDLERQIMDIMMIRSGGKLKSPEEISKEIEKAKRTMEKRIENDFRTLHDKIDADLSSSYGKPDHGENLENSLIQYMSELDHLGYANSGYARFAKNIEEMMNQKMGFDWIDGDKWQAGREARQAIRAAAYRMAWPIPANPTRPLPAKEQAYLQNLEDEIKNVLQTMQDAPDGNADWILVEDKRIPNADFYAAFKDRMDPFHPDNVPSPVASGIRTAPSPTPTASLEMDPGEIADGFVRFDDEIEDVYDDFLGKITTTPLWKDTFEAVWELKVKQDQDEFRKEIARIKSSSGGKIESTQFNDALDTITDEARLKLSTDYPGGITAGAATAQLVSEIVDLSDWEKPSSYLIKYLEDHPFTGGRKDILDTYWRNSNYGSRLSAGTGEKPINYTYYFIMTEVKGSGSALDYNTWLTHTGKGSPLDPYTHAEVATTPGSNLMDYLDHLKPGPSVETKESAIDDFNDWYSDNIRIAPRFSTEAFEYREWQSALDNAKNMRMQEIKSNPSTTLPDLKKQLELFKNILSAELVVLSSDIRTYQIDIDDVGGEGKFITNVINVSRQTAWSASAGKVPISDFATEKIRIGQYQTFLAQNFKNLRIEHGQDSIDRTDINKLLAEKSQLFTVREVAAASLKDPLNALNPMAWDYRLTVVTKNRFDKLFSQQGITDNAKKRQIINSFDTYLTEEKALLRNTVAKGLEEGEDYGAAYEIAAQDLFDKIGPILAAGNTPPVTTSQYKAKLYKDWEAEYKKLSNIPFIPFI